MRSISDRVMRTGYIKPVTDREPTPTLGLQAKWKTAGNCAVLSPAEADKIMFSESPADSPVWAEARLLCSGCPIKAQCLEVGMAEPYGMWGGLTPDERQSLWAVSA